MARTVNPDITTTADCPCGTGKTFGQCCGAYLTHAQIPATAEALMRSRYTAYVLRDIAYLLATWHSSTRPQNLDFDLPLPHWLGLKVLITQHGGITDHRGQVSFVARYKINGKACRLEENSQFIKENGRWYYVSGDPVTS